jgi:hypothetical protein
MDEMGLERYQEAEAETDPFAVLMAQSLMKLKAPVEKVGFGWHYIKAGPSG